MTMHPRAIVPFIGVPGEDSAAGIVQSTPTSGGADSTDIIVAEELMSWVGYTRGDIPGTNYGAVIASPAGEWAQSNTQ